MRKFDPEAIDLRWPGSLLILMAIAMPLSFSTWQDLPNNFVIDQVGFGGVESGLLQSCRGVPEFISFTAVFAMLLVRQQSLAIISLLLPGFGTASTGYFPSFWAPLMITFLMSVGFYDFESLHQSLTLHWIANDRAPEVFGRILSAWSIAALVSFGIIYGASDFWEFGLEWVYLASGTVSILVAIYCWRIYPKFKGQVKQRNSIVLLPSYWFWYALVLMTGARRQIFVVFASFSMVQKFAFPASKMSLIFFANMAMMIWRSPKICRLIQQFGERNALLIKYIGLVFGFCGYAAASQA